MFDFTFFLYLFLLAIASCQETVFLYPPPSKEAQLSFAVADILNATWKNSSDQPNLVLWCSRPNGDQARMFDSVGTDLQATGSFLVPITNSSGDASDRCHLELKRDPDSGGINSVNFAIKAAKDNTSPRIWGLDSSTESASSSSSTASKATSSTATSTKAVTTGAAPSTTVVPSQTSSGLSTGSKAGIGLGVGLAFAAGAAAVALFLLGRKKARAKSRPMLGPEAVHYEPTPRLELPEYTTATEYRPISEADGVSRAELPGASTMVGLRKP